MKTTLVYSLFLLLIGISSCTTKESITSPNSSWDDGSYDQDLASKFNADAYGMCSYIMANLIRGDYKPASEEEAAELMRGHLDNMKRMADAGVLVLAGPFGDTLDTRGIYIFDVPTIDSARVWTETDPAIQKGSLKMELRPWYGTAALKAIPQLHKKVAEKDV